MQKRTKFLERNAKSENAKFEKRRKRKINEMTKNVRNTNNTIFQFLFIYKLFLIDL